jgi:hypothetical protein
MINKVTNSKINNAIKVNDKKKGMLKHRGTVCN